MEIFDLKHLDKNEVDEIIDKFYMENEARKSFDDFIMDYSYCKEHRGIVYGELIDTEGLINGGIGEVCESCCEDREIRA